MRSVLEIKVEHLGLIRHRFVVYQMVNTCMMMFQLVNILVVLCWLLLLNKQELPC